MILGRKVRNKKKVIQPMKITLKMKQIIDLKNKKELIEAFILIKMSLCTIIIVNIRII